MKTQDLSQARAIRVLLIEDSEADELLLLRALKRGGFEPTCRRVMDADGLAAALDDEAWDLILADYNLPRFDAPRALKLVQSRGLDIPFIVVSGVQGEETAVAMMKAGAHDYLAKDRLDRLAPAIERELREVEVRRKRAYAEDALRVSEERMRLAAEATGFGTYDFDPCLNRSVWSPELYAIHGLSSETKADRQHSLDQIHPDDRESTLARMQQALDPAGTGYHDLEFRIVRADGQTRWLRDVGRTYFEGVAASRHAVRVVGTVHDITERKLTEEEIRQLNATLEKKIAVRTKALRRSEQALAAFFSHAPIGLMWVGREGRILRLNVSMWEMLGLPEDQVSGHSVLDFDANDSLKTILAAMREGGLPVKEHRARLRGADGVPVEVLIAAICVRKGRHLVRSEWFVRDITRRVELEREILNISEREQRRFGQDLHDDLCQTLVGIQFHCASLARQLASADVSGSAEMAEIGRMIGEAGNNAREMARGLSPMRLNPENLADALEELAARTNKLFGTDCRVECRNGDMVCEEAVGMHLYRIAQEAVANAVKHGGAKRIRIKLSSSDTAIVLGVMDDGKGLPADNAKTKGMGLRVMQYRSGIIGGSIVIQGTESGGTEVVCTVRRR